MSRLPASTGWLWLKQGFALFRKQPGFLTMVVFTNFLFAVLMSALPLLGPVLSLVFIPAFTMAIFQACNMIDEAKRPSPAVLLTGFRKPVVGPLCKLGLVYFGVFILSLLLVSPWIDTEAVRSFSKNAEVGAASLMQGSTGFAMLAYTMLVGVFVILLAFAPGLTYWKQMPTFKAIFYSVAAIVGSLRAVAVLVLAWLGIYWAAGMLFAMLLGRSQMVFVVLMWLNLIFVLVLHCALYSAYKQIMGAPEGDLKAP